MTNSNYTELAQLYQKYKDHGIICLFAQFFTVERTILSYGLCLLMFTMFSGFEILAFPCNQFGNQEPGSNEEIVQFACTRFKAEYPIFDKVNNFLVPDCETLMLTCDIYNNYASFSSIVTCLVNHFCRIISEC